MNGDGPSLTIDGDGLSLTSDGGWSVNGWSVNWDGLTLKAYLCRFW